MKLLRAIRIAHRDGKKPLNVFSENGKFVWDYNKDTSYINYSRAMNTISKHKKLKAILEAIGYI